MIRFNSTYHFKPSYVKRGQSPVSSCLTKGKARLLEGGRIQRHEMMQRCQDVVG